MAWLGVGLAWFGVRFHTCATSAGCELKLVSTALHMSVSGPGAALFADAPSPSPSLTGLGIGTSHSQKVHAHARPHGWSAPWVRAGG